MDSRELTAGYQLLGELVEFMGDELSKGIKEVVDDSKAMATESIFN